MIKIFSSHYGSLERNDVTGKQEWTGELQICHDGHHDHFLIIIIIMIVVILFLMIIIIKVMIHNMIIKIVRIDRRVGDGPGRSDRGPSHNQPRAGAGEGRGSDDDDHHHHHQVRAGAAVRVMVMMVIVAMMMIINPKRV